jgi:phosphate ABC transporter, phosphate-binding protein
MLAGGKEIVISGAGSSFPAPLYQKWALEFGKLHSNVRITYQPVGSTAGIKQFIAGTVDFGATDIPLTDSEIAKVGRGSLMLPLTGGSVVLAYNLPNVSSLRLSRATYINILSGKIRNWNDAAILADNPNVEFPNREISLVYRADPSSTTAALTRHLAAVSKEWRDSFGAGQMIKWRAGTGVAGSEAMSAQIQQNVGSLGYVEYGYALRNNLAMAQLQNRAGRFTPPNPDSQTNALARIRLPINLAGIEPDPLGDDSYPIVTYSWLLVYQIYPSAEKAKVIKAFVAWTLEQGQEFSPALGYPALSREAISQIQSAITQIRVA